MRELVAPNTVTAGLRRVAHELAAQHAASELVIVAIRRGGAPVADALQRELAVVAGWQAPQGTVDIALYRDDAATALPSPHVGSSSLPCPIQDQHIILIDDVLHTGRTIHAAMNALLDYGRPASIRLLVLVDRGGREFPICAQWAIHTEEIPAVERVDLVQQGSDLSMIVQPRHAPTPSMFPVAP